MSEIMLQAMEKLQRELNEARTQEKWHFDNYVYTQELYNELREERDRLAEALDKIRRWGCTDGHCSHIAGEALAAVKGEEPEDPHKYCRGGGGNNFHCGCKYDAQNHESYYP
jgi:hypothetical protein